MRTVFGFSLLLFTLSATACGPARVQLPTGAGTPTGDYQAPLSAALNQCAGINTLSGELALAGHAGSQRLRGRVLAGFAPGALRLEAVAPAGTPAFILVSDRSRARLLLGRDGRLVEDAKPEEILQALVGIALGPDDLRALLSGCLRSSVVGSNARAYGGDWLAVDLQGGGDIYLHRAMDGSWKAVAGHFAGLAVEYREGGARIPGGIQIRSTNGSRSDVDLSISPSQVEVNGDLPAEKLVSLNVPPSTTPMSLEELRREGPFGR